MAQEPRDAGRSRREFVGGVGAAAVAALAGCSQNPRLEDGETTTRQGAANDREGAPTTDDGGGASLSGEVKIAGSSTVFPLATQLRQAFQTEHPDVSIPVQSTGSGGGFANHFCPGRTDFNNASRPIKEEERQQCDENGVDPLELKVATDALTVVVNNDSPIDCVTVDQLREIWSAESAPQKWSDVDPEWPDEELELFGPTEASGTYDYFVDAVLGEDGEHRQDHQATEQDRTIINGVSSNEYAMGYMGFAYYTENDDEVTALAVDDGDGCVEPSLETARGGEYTPLSRPLFTYVDRAALARPEVREFARFWVRNTTNEEIVADDVGYVPLEEAERAQMRGRLEYAIDEVT